MKGLLFFIGLLIIVGVVVYKSRVVDSFNDFPANPDLTIPLISPRSQTLASGDVNPFTEPSTALLAPPPGQQASVNTRPAEDPALQKGKESRVRRTYELMKGFFEKEAIGLQKMGDPSVQLPMSTARSDFRRLRDEIHVIKRNPGIESSLTDEDLNGIEANLAYLQKKWRLSVSAGGGPMPPEEGFTDMPIVSKSGWFPSGNSREGFQGSGSGSSGSSPLALDDLKYFVSRIDITITRLRASGTTDPNVDARVKVLTSIKNTVNDLIADIKSGVKKMSDISTTREELEAILPKLSDLSTPISNIFESSGIDSVLNLLFPLYAGGDLSGSQTAMALLKTYLSDLTQNTSWDIEMHYKSPAEQEIARNHAYGRHFDKHDHKYDIDLSGNGDNSVDYSNYKGVMDSILSSIKDGKGESHFKGDDRDRQEERDAAAGGSTTGFNWYDRSKQICKQIETRGYKSYDFGCIKNPESIKDENFSWRGYMRMVCTRLGTLYDPSIPELCGCPPPSWIGWRP